MRWRARTDVTEATLEGISETNRPSNPRRSRSVLASLRQGFTSVASREQSTPTHEYRANPPHQPHSAGQLESYLTPFDHRGGLSPQAVRKERRSATHTAHVSEWSYPMKMRRSRDDGHACVTTRAPTERADPGAARGARSKARTLWISAANIPGSGLRAVTRNRSPHDCP